VQPVDDENQSNVASDAVLMTTSLPITSTTKSLRSIALDMSPWRPQMSVAFDITTAGVQGLQ
jgi:hypothetical protein